jgi:cell division septation protein DedD
MPNLNLKGDAPKAAAGGARQMGKPSGGPGGLPKVIIIVLGAVLGLAAIAFVLNKTGVVHLWGKKPVKVVAEALAPPVDTTTVQQQIDTLPLVEFRKEEPVMKKPARKTSLGSSMSTMDFATSEGGRYSVQVSSWSSAEKANIQSEVMTHAGFPAFVQKATVPGEGKRFRVYVGRYETEKQAHANAEKIAHMLEGGYWVVRLGK